MSAMQGFLDAIREEPEDDTPRLIFADWLDEHDEPARAELIRVQCELARCSAQLQYAENPFFAEEDQEGDRRRTLAERQHSLLEEHARGWTESLLESVNDYSFQRGFGCVTCSGNWWNSLWYRLKHLVTKDALATMLTTSESRRAWDWVLNLTLQQTDDNLLAVFASSPQVSGIVSLRLFDSRIQQRGAEALGDSVYFKNLARLDLQNNAVGPHGASALAHSPHLTRLRRLFLRMNGISDQGARALANSPNLARLIELNLNHNEISDKGAEALIASPYLPRDLWIHLHGNPCEHATGALAARFKKVTWGH